VYDKEAAKLEEIKKINGDPSLKGKSRAEMGLEEFTRTEIRSAVMGIHISITEEIIARASRCSNEGKFQWNLNNKTSSWIQTTYDAFHKERPSNKYKDVQKEHKVLHKLAQECFLPKGGGTYTLSLEHKVFLYFLVTFEKVNLPRYMFHHMIWALKESEEDDKKHIPYGRLLSEIFYQGGLLNVLRQTGVESDEHLRTVTGMFINGITLRYIGIVKKFVKRESDLKESQIVSDLMIDFPPISKQDIP